MNDVTLMKCPECGAVVLEGELEACNGTCESCQLDRIESANASGRAYAEAYGPADEWDVKGRL